MTDIKPVCNEFKEDVLSDDFCFNCGRAKSSHEGVFWHTCKAHGCARSVEFDDEPYCFTHSPDEGSSVYGYSAREEGVKQHD